MAGTRIKLDNQAVRDLLQSDEVQKDLERRGYAIAAAAGDGFDVNVSDGPTRVGVKVGTETFDAMRRQAKEDILTRALDAGRQ